MLEIIFGAVACVFAMQPPAELSGGGYGKSDRPEAGVLYRSSYRLHFQRIKCFY